MFIITNRGVCENKIGLLFMSDQKISNEKKNYLESSETYEKKKSSNYDHFDKKNENFQLSKLKIFFVKVKNRKKLRKTYFPIINYFRT